MVDPRYAAGTDRRGHVLHFQPTTWPSARSEGRVVGPVRTVRCPRLSRSIFRSFHLCPPRQSHDRSRPSQAGQDQAPRPRRPPRLDRMQIRSDLTHDRGGQGLSRPGRTGQSTRARLDASRAHRRDGQRSKAHRKADRRRQPVGRVQFQYRRRPPVGSRRHRTRAIPSTRKTRTPPSSACFVCMSPV